MMLHYRISIASIAALWIAAASTAQAADAPPGFVFVPYDKAAGPRIEPRDSVLIPYAEFLNLKAAGEKSPPPQKRPPVAALASAHFAGTVREGLAAIQARYELDAMAEPDQRFEAALPFEGAAIESASIEGPNASLAPLDSGFGLRAILHGGGKRTILLRLVSPIQTEGARNVLSFRAPKAAAAQLRLSFSAPVEIDRGKGDLPAEILPDAAGGMVLAAACGAADRIQAGWRERAEAAPEAAAESRLAVSRALRYSVHANSLDLSAEFRFEPLSGAIGEIQAPLPEGAQVLSISGPFLERWSVENRVAKAVLVRPIDEPFDLALEARIEAPPAETRIAPPDFAIAGAARESGLVVVSPDEGLSLWTEEQSGLESAAAPQGSPSAARAFRFSRSGWTLALTRQPAPARIRIQSTLLYEAAEEFTRLKSSHALAIEGRGVYDLAFEAPEGFTLSEAGPEEAVAGYRQNGRRIEINLRGEKQGALGIALSLTADSAKDAGLPRGIRLAPIALEGAEDDAGWVVLALPKALRAVEGASSGLESVDARGLQERIQPLLAAELEPSLGYRYFAPRFSSEATLERQLPRLTCDTALLASITPSLMRVDCTLTYNVEFSATDEFRFLAPAFAGENVRISGGDIKEKKRAETAAGDDLSTWTVRLQRRALGAYPLSVSFDKPLDGWDNGQLANVSVPMVRAAGVARETGHVAVSRGENLEVQVTRAEALERRDIQELPGMLAGAFLGFRYFDPLGRRLELSLVRHELESVLGAVIRRMHIETVVSDEREAIHEVFFEIQNNREQYLALKLPETMAVWSAFVRGAPTPTTTRQADGAKLIELTKSETLDSAFRVRLILRETLPGGKMGMAGRIGLNPPEPLNMEALRMTWKVYLPKDFRYLGFGGSMRHETGGSPPWLEPKAEKLLNDWPAALAGGGAAKQPPQAAPPLQYDTAETEGEKQARLRAAALDIPIERQGLQYVFSKLSGVGDVTIRFWKSRPLLLAQSLLGLAVFVLLLGWMGRNRRLAPAVGVTLLLYLAAGLSGGAAGRFLATALAGALAALLAGALWLKCRRRHGGAGAADAPGAA